MKLTTLVLPFVLALQPWIGAQQHAEVDSDFAVEVKTIDTALRFSGARICPLPDGKNALLLGPVKNSWKKGKFAEFEFHPFVNIFELANPGSIREIPEIEGAKHPPGRSYGDVLVDQENLRLHYFGGFDSKVTDQHWTLEFKLPLWKLDAPTSKKKPGPRDATASFLDADGKGFYLFGGLQQRGVLDELWHYEFASRSWTKIKNKRGKKRPFARLTARGLRLPDGRGLVIGGLDRRMNAIDEVWALSLKNATWKRQAELPEALSAPAVVWHPKLQLAITLGGSRKGKARKDVYGFDPQNDEWIELGELAVPIAHADAVYDAARDRILVMGGTQGMFMADHPETMIQSVEIRRRSTGSKGG